ncbi:MAG: 16S rRNA (adenine(1518)-N(6)/adenine(1519)-N(6))-dimethyltransferase RsmA, partial [Proteobacteria bacterium]|nr:16S rRNA (adenine(1518)-N(6)/adenine(1519)-N(6))-dimethyltransferase RsmA [Pseudomonadota bacterium]
MICVRRRSLTSDSDQLPSLRDVIDRYGLMAKKSLGQNFLLDLNLTAKIARAAGDLAGKNVIEIGPGPGGLTRALLDAPAGHVYTVERDDRCIQALQELVQAYPERLSIAAADALKVDVEKLCPVPRVIVANLPYNIATPLLVGWLRNITSFEGLTLMFQREVAQRITALPRSKEYGRLSVIAQWLTIVERKFDIPPSAFTPQPKVTSTVVHFVPRRDRRDNVSFSVMEKVTAAAFGQRRKMLRQSLKT